jgi:hypothetical protein
MTTFIFSNEWITQAAKIIYRSATPPDTSKYKLGLANSTTLTRASSIVDFVSAELLPSSGYNRSAFTISGDGSFNVPNLRHEFPSVQCAFSAVGGSLQFQSVFLLANALATSSKVFSSTNVNPTTNKITITSHGFTNGDKLCFTPDNLAVLPGGIATGTLYTVANITVDTFEIGIDITDTGSGTFRARNATGSVVMLAVEPQPITILDGQTYNYQIPIVLSNSGYVNGV